MKSFVKAVAKTVVGTFISVLLRIVSTKIVAVTVGPEGIGMLSLFRQILNVFGQISVFGSQKGIVHGLASREKHEYVNFLSSVVIVLLIGTVVGSALLVGLAPSLFSFFQQNDGLEWVTLIPWLIVPLLLNILLIFFQGILNGVKAIGSLAITQVIQGLCLAIVAYPISRLVSAGFPIAFVLFISVGLFGGVLFSGYKVYKLGIFQELRKKLFCKVDKADISSFIKFSATIFCSLFFVACVVLAIRVMAADLGGLKFAGYFDASWVICNTYLLFFSTSIVTYYFPALTELNSEEERYKLLSFAATLITVICVPLVVMLVELKPLLISLLYSKDFLPALDILRWMLIGGYLNVSASILGNLLLAKMELKVFFWKQLITYSSTFAIAYYAIYEQQSLEGLGVAYFIMCMINLLFLLFFCSFRYKRNYFKAFGLAWFIGLLFIIGASFISWDIITVNWLEVFLSLLCLVFFCFLIPTHEERKQVFMYVRSKFQKVKG